MKKLNINITKAQIISFNVELKEKKPEVSATLGLFTKGGKKITEYSIYTTSWNDDNTFELPSNLIMPILTIMKELENVIVKHCKDSQLLLKAK